MTFFMIVCCSLRLDIFMFQVVYIFFGNDDVGSTMTKLAVYSTDYQIGSSLVLSLLAVCVIFL
jgi:ABC-type antimicrobial peptide transport system permease subunit